MWQQPPGGTRTTTPQHRAWRRRVLERDNYQCQLRYPNRCTGTATEADHIIEVTDGGAAEDPANGQAVCEPCHAHKTALHANKKRWSHNTKYTEPHPGLR